MATGLQCPGCGHVHPAGLPEIARGDATFRCYGCYRTLSVPEGWTGQPTSRSPGEPGVTAGAPPGAGTRDARSARLAGRRGFWPGAGGTAAPPLDAGARSSAGLDAATELVPIAPGGPGLDDRGGPGIAGPGPGGSPDGGPAARGVPGRSSGRSVGSGGASLGRVASRPAGRVPAALRALTWVAAFTVGFLVSAVLLRTLGLLGVSTVLDLYAGSGLHRFGILLVMLPLWAVLSATIAHFSLEFLAARRRRHSPAPGPTADTPSTV